MSMRAAPFGQYSSVLTHELPSSLTCGGQVIVVAPEISSTPPARRPPTNDTFGMDIGSRA
jgi:hypothetical protein